MKCLSDTALVVRCSETWVCMRWLILASLALPLALLVDCRLWVGERERVVAHKNQMIFNQFSVCVLCWKVSLTTSMIKLAPAKANSPILVLLLCGGFASRRLCGAPRAISIIFSLVAGWACGCAVCSCLHRPHAARIGRSIAARVGRATGQIFGARIAS